MNERILGRILKVSAVFALAAAIRFDPNPVLYLLLGMMFFAGWKMQHLGNITVPRVKVRASVVARRVR